VQLPVFLQDQTLESLPDLHIALRYPHMHLSRLHPTSDFVAFLFKFGSMVSFSRHLVSKLRLWSHISVVWSLFQNQEKGRKKKKKKKGREIEEIRNERREKKE